MLCMGCMEELGGNRSCPHCGYKPETTKDPDCLKPGSVLAMRYLVGAPLRRNGESCLYTGYDNTTHKKVWIREYFPHTLARRAEDGAHVVPLDECGAQYKALMSDFMDVCNTVRRLAVSESVIPLDHVVSENNTLYAVYRYIPLISLESFLTQKGGSLDARRALELLSPLFGIVQRIHNLGEIHRGISPYTVYVDADGKLLLGDFMLPAARTGGSELEAELYNGYTAPEQYATNGWQGAWTDVYALAAVFYRAVSGSVPPKATLVGAKRPLPRLTEMLEACPQQISDAVEHAMQFDYEQRTQTVAAFVSELVKEPDRDGSTAVFDTSVVATAAGKTAATGGNYEDPPLRENGTFKFLAAALLLTVAVLIAFLYFLVSVLMPDLVNPGKAASASAPSSQSVQSSPPPESQASSGAASSSSSEAASSSAPEDKGVPRLIGQDIAEIEADSAYKDRFIFDKREEFNDSYDKGVVYDQAPPAGTPMPNKGVVILYISKGKPEITMPDLLGLTLDEAGAQLYELEKEYNVKLSVETFDVYAPDYEPGQVARTYPVLGETYNPKEGTIQLFIAIESNIKESVDVSSSQPDDPFSRPGRHRDDDDDD